MPNFPHSNAVKVNFTSTVKVETVTMVQSNGEKLHPLRTVGKVVSPINQFHVIVLKNSAKWRPTLLLQTMVSSDMFSV